jgi:transcription initiation factor IIE alpha subunit
MPQPKQNEKKNPFISRCVRELVHEEGRDPKQAVAVCYGIWDKHRQKELEAVMANYQFLQWLKGKAPSQTMVQCDHCLIYFEYTAQPEAGMGYVKCPGCGRNIDQVGKGVKKEQDEDFNTMGGGE